MPPWLAIWIARFAAGERFQRADRIDYRIWFGLFFLLPVGVALWVYYGQSYVSRASGMGVWFLLFISMLVFLAFSTLWARFVPALISLLLGIVTWFVAFWLAWHGKLGF